MKILEVQLFCNDLRQTRAFYHGRLGLPVLWETGSVITFKSGWTSLVFQHTDQQIPPYHLAFHVPNNRLAEALRWVEGWSPVLPLPDGGQIADFTSWRAQAFYFPDPAGNILEFIARFDLNTASDKPFEREQIGALSEFGMVVADVGSACKDLSDNYGIPVFSKQAPQQDFAAMGDDEGLLILVSENRDWYPTNIRSGIGWSEIKIVCGGLEIELETPML